MLTNAGTTAKESEKATRRFVVRNRTRGTIVAEDVHVADTPSARRVGLLKHSELKPREGLWIYPCQAVHTFWMRFPIDVAFLDRHRRVRRVYHRLLPFRLTRFVWRSRSVLELAAGVLEESRTESGDELEFSRHES
ncbi:MAG: DUF192 domain-containing protein [Acidobacteria bacterium]|nr:DUF192 domain-containing protein [Acidobacteriota bacterium]